MGSLKKGKLNRFILYKNTIINLLRLHETNFARLTDVRFTKSGFPPLGNFYVRK